MSAETETLTIYGASDDLVEADGIEGADEFGTSGHWIGMIVAPGGDTAMIYVDYRRNGCWTVALGRYDEDYALPSWGVEIVSDDSLCGYSTVARIRLPKGSTLQEVQR